MCIAIPFNFLQLLDEKLPLRIPGDLSAKQVTGMHRYLDRALAAAPKERAQFWKVDGSSPEAYAKSVEPNREHLRKMLGVVDARVSELIR